MLKTGGNNQEIVIDGQIIEADLFVPTGADAIILFAHGSGSSRHSTRNQYVARVLNDAGFATLLVDLLSMHEKKIDEKTRHMRYNIDLLTSRLLTVTHWLRNQPETRGLRIGYFASSTGAAAALISAAKLGDVVKTVVCRGGRPDLAESRGSLSSILAPVLLIVGGNDAPVIGINKSALNRLSNAQARDLAIIPDASHLFEEPGMMEKVAQVARQWFECYLAGNGGEFKNKYSYSKAFGLLQAFKKPVIQLRLKDRTIAGDMLASVLRKHVVSEDTTVIGIARGGVVVAHKVAKKVQASDFDIVVAKRLRAPDNPENAIGALMQDGYTYLDTNIVTLSKISTEYIEAEKQEQQQEISRRLASYRPRQKEYSIFDKTVLLVDDGIATGSTAIAAARWIRKQKPKSLIIGAPVIPQHVIELLKQEADDVAAIFKPLASKFKTVEQFYQDFSPTSDQDIIHIVREFHKDI